MGGDQRAGLGQNLDEALRQLRQANAAHHLVQPVGKQLVLDVIVQESHGGEALDDRRQRRRVGAGHLADCLGDS
jgi:hypothetical protein